MDGRYFPGSYLEYYNTHTREYLLIFNRDYNEIPDAALQVNISQNDVPLMYWLTVNRNVDVPFSPNYSGEDQFEINPVRQVTTDDIFTFSTDFITTVSEHLPVSYELFQNYPNPFNPTTKIRFSVPYAGIVELALFNILGQKVKSIINQEFGRGVHEIEFNGSNLSSGVYFYQIKAGDYISTKKMLLLK